MNIKTILIDTKKLNILYVEDSESTRESTAIVLRDIFKNVFLASDGKIGFETYIQQQNEIDIIITDIQMPNVNGFEMIEQIRTKSPDIPIFIFSAYNEADYLFDAVNLNVSGYILKPFDLYQFLKALKIVIENINLKKNLENTVKEQILHIRKQDKLLEIQSKQAAMGEMIDVIAHQWGNPLSQISVLSSTMLYQNDEQNLNLTSEQIGQYGNSILQQVTHMNETLNEFRSFFRENKNYEKTNIFSLIHDSLILVQDQLKNNQINYVFTGEKSIELELIKNEFKHVILNLISNSKYSFIENNIDRRTIRFDIEQKDQYVVLEFSDNAGGIRKDIIDRIFQANITNKQEQGTGIGLYISKQIIEKSGGEIRVKNNIQNGATFTIVLKQTQSHHE